MRFRKPWLLIGLAAAGPLIFFAPQLASIAITRPSQIVYTANGTGATSRTLASKLGDVVSVMDFGAKGDGIADDRAAIQAAINSLPANGGVITIPPSTTGTYLVSSTLTISVPLVLQIGAGTINYTGTGAFISCSAITRGVLIIGIGQRGDQGITVAGTTINISNTAANGIDSLNCPGIRIQNLSIIGPGSGTGTGMIISGHGFALDNVQVANFGVDGVRIDGVRANSNTGSFLRVSAANNLGNGFRLTGTNANNIVMAQTDALFNATNYRIETFSNVFVGAHAISTTDVTNYVFIGASNNVGSIYSEPISPFAAAAVTFDATSNFNDLFLLNGRIVTDSGLGNNWYFGANDFTPSGGVRRTWQTNTNTDTAFNPIQRFERKQQTTEQTDFGIWVRSASTLSGPMWTTAGGFNFRYNTAGFGRNVSFWNNVPDASMPTGTPALQLDSTGNGESTFGGMTHLFSVTQASLGTPVNGTIVYCSDCLAGSNPCSGASTGSLAVRQNGAWKCF